MTQSKQGCLIALVLLGALVLALYWVGRPAGWREMAKLTGVKVPAGAVMSAVEHPTEVVYLGTIDLKSDGDVKDFIHLNGLTRMIEHVPLHPWVHLGDVDLSKEPHAGSWMLLAHNDLCDWEFILVPSARRVNYVVLVRDHAGDLPFDERSDGGKSEKW